MDEVWVIAALVHSVFCNQHSLPCLWGITERLILSLIHFDCLVNVVNAFFLSGLDCKYIFNV